MREACVLSMVLAVVFLASTAPVLSADGDSADVVVYTATASGVTASVAAAREGMNVVLIEPGRHVGGMLSGGLGHSDVLGQEDLIGGLAAEVFRRMAKHYGKQDIKGAFDFEPHVAENTLKEMLREAGVRVVFGERVVSVTKEGPRITSIRTQSGSTFTASVFIDAGYEGDLMAQAHVSYAVGREGRDKYGESLAGRMELLPGNHQFKCAVSPWKDGKLLPFIVPQSQLVPTGQGDGKLQAYCFRLCLTDRPDNRIPITKPEHYSPDDYALLRRYYSACSDKVRGVLGIHRVPNGKCDLNSTGPVSTNLPGAAWEYPDATYERRHEIWDRHLRWAHGLLWFLQTDACVPEKYRNTVRRWGLCKDEFTDTGGWPHQMYIREGRRMLGETVLTQHDLEGRRSQPDSIGMCGYNIDIREVQWVSVRVFRFPHAEDEVFMEGYVSQPVKPWQIPYRALTPKVAECENLLVSVCASMSTIAFASFRMEAGYMIAGHAAGVAAALAADHHVPVQQVDRSVLQRQLCDQNQILTTPKHGQNKRQWNGDVLMTLLGLGVRLFD